MLYFYNYLSTNLDSILVKITCIIITNCKQYKYRYKYVIR